MNTRVARLSQIVKDYQGTSVSSRVGVREKEGKLQLTIGGRNPYDTAGRRVKQLKHAVSQFGASKHEKTSYEGEKLKRFVQEHGSKDLAQRLAQEGVFKGTVTYGKLQTIAQALEQEGKAISTELDKTIPHPLEKQNAETTPPPVVVPSPQRPKAQAKQNWLNRTSKKERASSREKASFKAQRGVFYGDLTPEDQASIKTLVQSKLASLNEDRLAVMEKEFNFKSSAQQKLEQHVNKFPDLMRFATMASPDKSIKYKTPELAQKAIRDKLADIDTLIKNLQAEHVELEGKAKERIDAWIGSVKNLLNAWKETNYINLDARALGFVDDFCKQAASTFDTTYHALALKAKNIQHAYTELEAIEEEPLDRLLKESSFSPEAQGFLLQELARFSSQNAELKGLEKYEAFIQHLSNLENNTGIPEAISVNLLDDVQFDPIDTSGSQYRSPAIEGFEAVLAQEKAKEAVASNPSDIHVSDSQNPSTEGSLRADQYAKILSDLLSNPNNKQDLNLALKAYAKKRNQMTQLTQAKLLGQGEGMASIEEIYNTNTNLRNWVIQDMAPRITNQSLSFEEMETINKNIILYVASKNNDLLLGLEFKGQDEDLKTLFRKKVSQANPNLRPSDLDAFSQKLMDEWHVYKDQIGAKSLIAEGQITSFLDGLEAKINGLNKA